MSENPAQRALALYADLDNAMQMTRKVRAAWTMPLLEAIEKARAEKKYSTVIFLNQLQDEAQVNDNALMEPIITESWRWSTDLAQRVPGLERAIKDTNRFTDEVRATWIRPLLEAELMFRGTNNLEEADLLKAVSDKAAAADRKLFPAVGGEGAPMHATVVF